MKVFISWSGERSQLVAQALRDWLPMVLHYVEPWLSQSDIEAGERWATGIAKELESSNFGVICITRENIASPWILFEAGALTKYMQEGRVIPLLLDVEFKDIVGPLAQFQAKKVEKSGLSDVINSINQLSDAKVPESRLIPLFQSLWPVLETRIADIPQTQAPAKQDRPQHEILEELVSSIRGLELRYREAPDDPSLRRRRKNRLHPIMIDEMMRMSGEPGNPVGILMAASVIRDEIPWLYELAMDVYRTLKSGTIDDLEQELERLRRFSEFALRGPFMEEFGLESKETHVLSMEFPRILERSLRSALETKIAQNRTR